MRGSGKVENIAEGSDKRSLERAITETKREIAITENSISHFETKLERDADPADEFKLEENERTAIESDLVDLRRYLENQKAEILNEYPPER